jgi:hypothetical protein
MFPMFTSHSQCPPPPGLCLQCTRLHALADFDGVKRSCKASLQRRLARKHRAADPDAGPGDTGPAGAAAARASSRRKPHGARGAKGSAGAAGASDFAYASSLDAAGGSSSLTSSGGEKSSHLSGAGSGGSTPGHPGFAGAHPAPASARQPTPPPQQQGQRQGQGQHTATPAAGAVPLAPAYQAQQQQQQQHHQQQEAQLSMSLGALDGWMPSPGAVVHTQAQSGFPQAADARRQHPLLPAPASGAEHHQLAAELAVAELAGLSSDQLDEMLVMDTDDLAAALLAHSHLPASSSQPTAWHLGSPRAAASAGWGSYGAAAAHDDCSGGTSAAQLLPGMHSMGLTAPPQLPQQREPQQYSARPLAAWPPAQDATVVLNYAAAPLQLAAAAVAEDQPSIMIRFSLKVRRSV